MLLTGRMQKAWKNMRDILCSEKKQTVDVPPTMDSSISVC